MKVKIKDLEPNPFRDMKNYPINEEKVQSLTNSIEQTGFWDNILARKNNGKIEIAYGHHRLIALQRKCKPDHFVDIPVKALDDATMIKIMANENMENWATSPKIIDETVRVAFEYLKKEECLVTLPPREKGSHGFLAFEKLPIPKKHEAKRNIITWQISNWLGKNWTEERIWYSLERLKLTGQIESEKGEEIEKIDKEAIETLPTDDAARHFVKAVKKIKDVTPEQQKKAAEKIIKTQNFGESSVHNAIIEEKYPYEEKEEKEKEFEEFIEECSKLINTLNRKLDMLIDFKSDFDSKYYKKTFARFEFDGAVNILQLKLIKLLEAKK